MSKISLTTSVCLALSMTEEAMLEHLRIVWSGDLEHTELHNKPWQEVNINSLPIEQGAGDGEGSIREIEIEIHDRFGRVIMTTCRIIRTRSVHGYSESPPVWTPKSLTLGGDSMGEGIAFTWEDGTMSVAS